MKESEIPIQEIHEQEVPTGLETYLIFVRHGKAEKHTDDISKDSERPHTPEGEKQVYEAGKKFAQEVKLQANDVIFQRSSPRVRAQQTVTGALDGFVSRQKELGCENINIMKSSKPAREGLNVLPPTGPSYIVGSARRGTSSGLCEEWTRNPEIFQKDLDSAGLSAKAGDTLKEQKENFQHEVSVVNRARTMLAEKWKKSKKEGEDTPPRLFIFQGSHGSVSEPWLLDVVKEYESAHNKKIRLELGYGEYFTIHFPENQKETPTLNISGESIPISKQYLEKLSPRE